MAVIIERDVVVVGAGPAGSICAAYLAKEGLDVLLIDKEDFPRSKACGDMLREGIVKHIERLDAIDMLDEKSTCVRRIKLISSGGNEAVLPFECYSLPRYELDRLLSDTAASWGAELRRGCRLVELVSEGDKVCGVVVREKGAEYQIRCRIVVGADGVDSQTAKELGVHVEQPSGMWVGARTYFKGMKLERSLAAEQYDAGAVFSFDEKAGPAYFWIMPVGRDGVKRGICNVGMMLSGRDSYSVSGIIARLEAWMDSSDKIREMFEGAEQIEPWDIGRIADKTQERASVVRGGLLIGDASSQMVPLTGDGVSAAADTAKAAAESIAAAFKTGDFSEEVMREAYKSVLYKLRPEKSEDEIKSDRLLIESLDDPRVMDRIIEKLAKDPNYRKKV